MWEGPGTGDFSGAPHAHLRLRRIVGTVLWRPALQGKHHHRPPTPPRRGLSAVVGAIQTLLGGQRQWEEHPGPDLATALENCPDPTERQLSGSQGRPSVACASPAPRETNGPKADSKQRAPVVGSRDTWAPPVHLPTSRQANKPLCLGGLMHFRLPSSGKRSAPALLVSRT